MKRQAILFAPSVARQMRAIFIDGSMKSGTSNTKSSRTVRKQIIGLPYLAIQSQKVVKRYL